MNTVPHIGWNMVGKRDFPRRFQEDPDAALDQLTSKVSSELLNPLFLNTHRIMTVQHKYCLISSVIKEAVKANAKEASALFIRTLVDLHLFPCAHPLDIQSSFNGQRGIGREGLNDPCRLIGEALSFCIEMGNESIASLVIQANPINDQAFFYKACKRNLAGVVEVIAGRIDSENLKRTLSSGLNIAAEAGAIHALRTLIKLGADPATAAPPLAQVYPLRTKVYALHSACREVQKESLEILLPHLKKEDLDIREEGSGLTPLNILFQQLERCFDPLRRERENRKVLQMAALILQAGADPGTPTIFDLSILHDLASRWSIFPSEIEFVKLLIEAGLDIHARGPKGTPIERLISYHPRGGADLFKLLLFSGASPLSTKKMGVSWIEQIFEKGHVEFLEEFFFSFCPVIGHLFLKHAGKFSDFAEAVELNAASVIESCRNQKQNPIGFAWMMQNASISRGIKGALMPAEIEEMENEYFERYGLNLKA